MARLTTYGQNYVAQAVGGTTEFVIDEFIFAFIPGIEHTTPEDINQDIPDVGDIVLRSPATNAGIIDENRVTFSKMLLQDVGDFNFNWIGITHNSQLVMFAHVPITQKVKSQGATEGNVLTRNMVVEHVGIADAMPVNVSAESWMYDFSDQLNAMQASIITNAYGLINTNTRVIENAHDNMRLSERVRLLETIS